MISTERCGAGGREKDRMTWYTRLYQYNTKKRSRAEGVWGGGGEKRQ